MAKARVNARLERMMRFVCLWFFISVLFRVFMVIFGGALSRLTTPRSATAERGALAAERRRGQDGRRWRDGRQQPA